MAPSHAVPKLDPAPSGASHRRRRLAPWLILAALFLLTYAWTFRDLVSGWMSRDRLVLGLVVLAGAAFLAWDRREDVARAPFKPSRWGLALIVVSLLLLFVGTRAGLVFLSGMTSVFLRGVSVVAFLCGTVLLLYGWRAMTPLWLPALLLLFIYPENALTTYWVPLRLQTLAAVICENVIAVLGIAVVREGHVLETAGFSANVEEACSGIRSLMTVVPTAIFISAYGLHRPGPRAALVLLAVPVTILANVVRVTVTVLVGIYIGKAAAIGFFHYFAGLGIFVLCLMGLLILLRLLRLVESRQTDVEGSKGRGIRHEAQDSPGQRRGWPLSRPAVLAIAGVLVIGTLYQGIEIHFMRVHAGKYPSAPLAAIPKRIGQWMGEDLPNPLDLEASRHVSDSLFREYRAPGQPPVQVMLLYWHAGAGTLLGRRAHLPEGCYPYHGMKQEWTRALELKTSSAVVPRISVHTSAFSSSDAALIVTSWQQAGLKPRAGAALPRGRLGLLAYGLREIIRIGEPYPPELAIQLISAGDGPVDRITFAHQRFAPPFVVAAVDAVLAPAAQSHLP